MLESGLADPNLFDRVTVYDRLSNKVTTFFRGLWEIETGFKAAPVFISPNAIIFAYRPSGIGEGPVFHVFLSLVPRFLQLQLLRTI